jgi:hypothetical protein
MGYPISTMIGIRTGGVFSGTTDMEKFKKRVTKIIEEQEKEGTYRGDLREKDLENCMSTELLATKGAYVIIAGVFNYWNYENGTSELGKRLSKELCVEVMVMTWDEQTGRIDSDVFWQVNVCKKYMEIP